MRSSNPSVVEATQERMQVCMNALKDVSKVWLVAKMVHTLFESILGNKVLEERLQKAPGKRHKKARVDRLPQSNDEQQKRKQDEMPFAYSNGPPAPQVSYERSRPQTPAVTPSRDLGQSAVGGAMAAPSTLSPTLRHTGDTFLGTGASRNNTRPPTPFNPSYSVPATPPDLYLVTRNSPPISQNLWENFQPDLLFPDGTNMAYPQHQYSSSHQQNLDPQLQMAPMQNQSMPQPPMPGQQHLPARALRGSQDAQANMNGVAGMQQPNGSHLWPNQFPADGSEDNWSNSSRGQSGISVPTTLNVEDW